jgi:hypothetical protein
MRSLNRYFSPFACVSYGLSVECGWQVSDVLHGDVTHAVLYCLNNAARLYGFGLTTAPPDRGSQRLPTTEHRLYYLMQQLRSVFSRQQIEMMFWSLKANAVSRVPSAKTLRSQNAVLHSMCGVPTLEYDDSFGDTYFINSLADARCYGIVYRALTL